MTVPKINLYTLDDESELGGFEKIRRDARNEWDDQTENRKTRRADMIRVKNQLRGIDD